MNNFFKKIQQFPQNIKENKEEVALNKQEIMSYLLKNSSGEYPHSWHKFNEIIAKKKLIDDKEISDAIKEGYLNTLKQYVGELPIIITKNGENKTWRDQHVCFDRTKVIFDIFHAIQFQKWNEKNSGKAYLGEWAKSSFIESFKDNPEFLRLTKESLIKSINQVDTGEEIIWGAQVFLPAVIPDEIKKSPEVQKAAKEIIIKALQNVNLSLAIDFQERLQLTQEMIQSPDLQQAILGAIEVAKEKLEKIKEKRYEVVDKFNIDPVNMDEVRDEEERIRKIERWTTNYERE